MVRFDYYTPAEAARRLGVSRQRVSELMRLGVLSRFDQGGRVFVPRRSVEMYEVFRKERAKESYTRRGREEAS